MQIFDLLSTNAAWLVTCSFLFGLLMGSFLNVVIYRLPIMLEANWQSECLALLERPADQDSGQRFNLISPRSQCPACKHTISSLENIPVVSYLFQKGKCRHCGASISIQYPLIELFTAVLTGYIAYRFGHTWQMLAACFFAWGLLALAAIDFRTTLAA